MLLCGLQVCGKQTGHAEVVGVVFDPSVISFEDLLDVFFTIHDPTTPNRQGNDVGPQYRSIILYGSEQQKATAEKVMKQVAEEGWYDAPLVTELVPLTKWYTAERHHQNYYNDNPRQVTGDKHTRHRGAGSGEKARQEGGPSLSALTVLLWCRPLRLRHACCCGTHVP